MMAALAAGLAVGGAFGVAGLVRDHRLRPVSWPAWSDPSHADAVERRQRIVPRSTSLRNARKEEVLRLLRGVVKDAWCAGSKTIRREAPRGRRSNPRTSSQVWSAALRCHDLGVDTESQLS